LLVLAPATFIVATVLIGWPAAERKAITASKQEGVE